MFKKIKKFTVVCLGVVVLLTGLQINATQILAANQVNIKIESHGVTNNVEKPNALLDGQVWSDKSVVDHGDGSFTISLSVASKAFQGVEGEQQALADETNVILTDVIGEGFELVGDMPQHVTITGNVVTWQIAANDVSNDFAQPSHISFDVKFIGDSAGEFVTNESASAVFTPNMENPYYYDTDEVDVQAKKDFNWNENSVTSTLSTTGFLTVIEEVMPDTIETLTKETNMPEGEGAVTLGTIAKSAPRESRSSLERAQNDALVTTKNSTFNADGTLNIDLEAYVTGSVISHTEPVDIVLVLDQSGSMNQEIQGMKYENFNYHAESFHENILYVKVKGVYYKLFYDGSTKEWYYKKGVSEMRTYVKQKWGDLTEGYEFYQGDSRKITRREALVQAVGAFVSSMSEDAIAGNINHRIAIVGFGDGKANSYTSTEILSLASGKKNYQNLMREDFKNAFQDANTTDGYDILMNSVNQVSSVDKVLTNTDLGLEMAHLILEDGSKNERQKAVIVFTDGGPNDNGNNGTSINYSIANKALSTSASIKSSNASVYSVGIIEGADPKTPLVDHPSSLDGQINKFMQLLSSNYKDAGSGDMDRIMSNDASNPQNNGFYLTAKSADELSQIFGKIYEEISPSILLNDKAKLIDTISDYFTVTNDTVVDVKTSKYTGKDSQDNMEWASPVLAEGVNVKISGNKIEVSGFDYSAEKNVVFTRADNTGDGYKLIVSLKNIKPLAGFIGGDLIPTNKSDSGIYDANNTPVEHFEMPTVNVPLKFDFNSNDASVYVGNTWNDVLDLLANKNGNMYYLQDGKEYEFGNKRNDFVDVMYTIKHGNNIVGTYMIYSKGNVVTTIDEFNLDTSTLISDIENLSITVYVISKNDETNQVAPAAKESSLYIFKPSIDVSDTTIFLGEDSKIEDRVSNTIDWENAENINAPKPKGDVPSLSITAKEVKANGNDNVDFDQKEQLKETTQYKLMIKNKEKDITGVTTIKNTTEGNDRSDTHDFTVYVLKGQLDITKTIDQQYTTEGKVNANQSFVYKIDQFNDVGNYVKTFYQTINFSANEDDLSKSISITGLGKGKYTISELTDWSWKYEVGTSSSNDLSNNKAVKDIFIGNDDANFTSGKPFYGSEDGSVIRGVDVSNKAIAEFSADKKMDTAIKNILGDVASAINQFVK